MSTTATPPWDRFDLDGMGCQREGCPDPHHHGPIFLTGRCHPKKPVEVRYRFGGVLVCTCSVCTLHIANVAVAPDAQQHLDEHLRGPCGDPSCVDHELHTAKMKPPCHPRANAYVTYTPGTITVACGVCKEAIAQLPVKERTAHA